MSNPKDILAALKAKLEAEDLDDLVHEAKSKEASSINNGGLDEQVDYLLGAYGIQGTVDLLEATVENKS